MRAFREHGRGRSAYAATALVALIVVFAAGFCVSDTHTEPGHGHAGVSVDLCLAMLGMTTAVAPLIGLAAIGWVPASLAPAFVPASMHVLTPPPKLALR